MMEHLSELFEAETMHGKSQLQHPTEEDVSIKIEVRLGESSKILLVQWGLKKRPFSINFDHHNY